MGNKKIVRVDEIDIAKGLGILLVIVGHLLPEDSWARQIIYSFHMPLFMILSGMVISDKKESKLSNNIKKESNLIIAYLFWSVFYILFDFFIKFLFIRMIDIEKIIADIYQMCTLYGISVLWFISTLFISKIITKYINSVFNVYPYKKAVIAILLFGSSLFLRMRLVELHEEVKGFLNYIIYFPMLAVLRSIAMTGFVLLGTCFKPYFQYIQKNFSSIKILMCVGGGTAIILVSVNLRLKINFDYHYLEVGNGISAYALAIIGFLCIGAFSSFISLFDNKVKTALCYLGKNSLFIMATHEYLLLKELVDLLINIKNPFLEKLLEVVALILIEVLLCKFVGKYYNQLLIWIKYVYPLN